VTFNFFKLLKLEGMEKPFFKMLVIVGIVFGCLFGYKGFKAVMMNWFLASESAPVMTVSTTKAVYSTWVPELKAVGSGSTVLGVNITAQLGGMVQTIYFKDGDTVKKGDVLVQQNADPNIALLHSLQANAELARITYERDSKQYKVKAVSKQQVDSDLQNWKSLIAQVDQQQAIVQQLVITAPFDGRLGISNVNPGQYLNPGDTVVTLQSLDPIYIDFYLPQQALSQLKLDQAVTATIDAFTGKVFNGKITAINPIVDTSTRNVQVRATFENPEQLILPGMFANVSVITDAHQDLLTLPQTAISFNPYGSIAYIVKETGKDKNNAPILTANQVFVTTGDSRGDQIAVLTGIKAGDEIVTSGQLKLKNGSHVAINNKVQPSDNPNPSVPNEHGG
jgi:membrane fusion protein (multidrug efflux system)